MSGLEDSYRSELGIPDDHKFTLVSEKSKNSGGRDDEWFSFQETDPEGNEVAIYNVESLQQINPPQRASCKITKTTPDGEVAILRDEKW